MDDCASKIATAPTSPPPPPPSWSAVPRPSSPPLPPSCLAASSTSSVPTTSVPLPGAAPIGFVASPTEFAAFEFKVGDEVDVRDMIGRWNPARVVARRVGRRPLGGSGGGGNPSQLPQQRRQIRVRFVGWEADLDEWVDASDSRRVAPRGCMTGPLATPPTGPGDAAYAFGDHVLVALSEAHRNAYRHGLCPRRPGSVQASDGGVSADEKAQHQYKWVAGAVISCCGRHVQVEVHGGCFDGDGDDSERCDSEVETGASDGGGGGGGGGGSAPSEQCISPGGPAWPPKQPYGQPNISLPRDIGTSGSRRAASLAARVWVHRGNICAPGTWPHGGAVCEIQPRSAALFSSPPP